MKVLLLGTVIVMAQLPYLDEFEVQGQGPLKRFSSYEELKNYVNARSEFPPHYNDRFMLKPSFSVAAEESSLHR